MEKIKASEVSSLLKQQLEKFDASSKLEEVGTVLTVGDGIATAFGLCVAILALAVHAYFTQRLDRIITDMELCFSALETMAEKVGQ